MKKTLIMLASLAAFASFASASVTYTVAGAYSSGGSGQLLHCRRHVYFDAGTDGAAGDAVIYVPLEREFRRVYPLLHCALATALTTPSRPSLLSSPSMTLPMAASTFSPGRRRAEPSPTTGLRGSSNVSVSWSPLQIGPGTNNLTGGTTFGPTFFTIGNPTPIVDPTTNAGIQTISGVVGSTATPEPATFGMMGAALVGLGFIARKRKA